MEVEYWKEPKEEYIKRMMCPKCGKTKIRWAICEYKTEDRLMRDCWLRCEACGYDLEEHECPQALYGLEFLERYWAISGYDIEVDKDNNVVSFLVALSPITEMELEELQDMLHSGIREHFC